MEAMAPDLRRALVDVVRAAAVRRIELGPKDLRKRVAFKGGSSLSTSIEPGFGVQARIALLRWLESESSEFAEFQRLAANSHSIPRWIGTGFGGHALEPQGLIAHLAQLAANGSEGGDESVERIVSDLARALEAERVELVCTAFLENCAGVPESLYLRFENGVVLQRLADVEFEDLLETDINEAPRLSPFSNRLVLRYEFETALRVSPGLNPEDTPWQPLFARFELTGAALHCFKPGSIPIAMYRLDSRNPSVPVGGLTIGEHRPQFSAYALSDDELPRLEGFVRQCLKPCRPKLELAKQRLSEAEVRRSPVDAIVDAFVGIEALLNPDNAPELSLRVALNYATLGPSESARSRFRTLRDLYKVRSKIVHGDHKEGGTYKVCGSARSTNEIADISKALLRNLIHTFIHDDKLRSEVKKLDIGFWEERYFPNAVLSE